jgi:hypothetical protein
MSPEPKANSAEQKIPSAKTLSIEIELSYPLITAMVQFFRDQNNPKQSLELCRLGLTYFPGDQELRLQSALAYLDLEEPDQAWVEIKNVARELGRLAPVLDSISNHLSAAGQSDLAQWLYRLAQILSNSPGERTDNPTLRQPPSFNLQRGATPPLKTQEAENTFKVETDPNLQTPWSEKKVPSSSIEDHRTLGAAKAEGGIGDSNVLATLTGWLTQLKGSKA